MDASTQHKIENRDEELAIAFLRGAKLVEWMMGYIGKMAPGSYSNAYVDLNEFGMFNERVNRLAKQLTAPQVDLLQAAVRHGHAFANVGMRSRAGGAKARMSDRLSALGLVTPAPVRITVLGRIVLNRKTGRF